VVSDFPPVGSCAAAFANRNYHLSLRLGVFRHAFDFNTWPKSNRTGHPPTGSHLAELLDVIRQNNVKLVIQEPYFSETCQLSGAATPVKVLKLPPSCAATDASSYLDHFSKFLMLSRRELTYAERAFLSLHVVGARAACACSEFILSGFTIIKRGGSSWIFPLRKWRRLGLAVAILLIT